MAMRAKKHFGQHFLVSQSHAARIAAAVPAGAGDVVVEIGAGAGALSVHLARRFPRLHCIEKDRDLVPLLREKLTGTQATIRQADALTFDLCAAGPFFHVVGNLPYSVGALIIHRVLLCGESVGSCTFMVQREVAERICARPHGKSMGYLSVFCQYFGTPRILFHVPPGAFSPRPTVDSSVFQLAPERACMTRVAAGQWQSLFALVSLGFSQRRKMLGTVLRKSLTGDVAGAMEDAGIRQGARAEDLDVDGWCRLWRALAERGVKAPANRRHSDADRRRRESGST